MFNMERDSRRRPHLAAGSGVLPSLIDDGIRPLIQISQEVFLLDGFEMAVAAWHETPVISSRRRIDRAHHDEEVISLNWD